MKKNAICIKVKYYKKSFYEARLNICVKKGRPK